MPVFFVSFSICTRLTHTTVNTRGFDKATKRNPSGCKIRGNSVFVVIFITAFSYRSELLSLSQKEMPLTVHLCFGVRIFFALLNKSHHGDDDGDQKFSSLSNTHPSPKGLGASERQQQK
jgi:hypothetical protein